MGISIKGKTAKQTFFRFGVKKTISFEIDSASEITYIGAQNLARVLLMTETDYLKLA